MPAVKPRLDAPPPLGNTPADMPSVFGQAARARATLTRLARFFSPDADPWERLCIEVNHRVFGQASIHAFQRYLEGPSAHPPQSLEALCAWLRECRSADDTSLFRKDDHWQHPAEFERLRQGDCEDHALWAWRQLRHLGIPALFVTGLWRTTAHAWILLQHQGAELLLETTAKEGPMLLPVAVARSEYCPGVAVDHAIRTFVYQGYQRFHRQAGPPPPAAITPTPPPFEIAILAGGRSSRMGRDKARLRLHGRSLLAHIRATARTLDLPVHVVRRDVEPGHGPLGGILTALQRTRAPIVLVLSCDMPAVTPALLQRVVDALGPGHLAALAAGDGRPGFPLAVRRTCRPALRECLEQRRLSLRDFARATQAVTVPVPPSELEQLANLNTPADLAEHRRALRVARGVIHLLLAAVLLLPAAGARATPPAESWLPAETTAFVTVPDARTARLRSTTLASLACWSDPAMAPVRTGAERHFEERLVQPLRAASGLDLPRLWNLAQGQVTLAAIAPSGPTGPTETLLLVDAGPHPEALDAFLHTALVTGPPGGPAPVNAWKTGNHQGWTLTLDATRLRRVFESAFPAPTTAPTPASGRAGPNPAPAGGPVPPRPFPLHLARTGNTLLATTAPTSLLAAALDRLDAPAPEAPLARSQAALARESRRWTNTLVHAWAGGAFVRTAVTNALGASGAGRSAFAPDRILAALGLLELEGAAFALRGGSEGWTTEWRAAIPAPIRRGLFELLTPLPADASPPEWVGENVLSFRRSRVPGPAAWKTLERALHRLDPALLGVLQLFTEYAGRTEDADFRFDRDLVARLGDDWIAVTHPTETPQTLGAGLLVLGTTNAPQIHHALTLVASPLYLATFTPPGTPPPSRSETQLHGRRVVSVGLPLLPWQSGPPRQLHLATRDHWVALAGTLATVDAFLAPSNAHPPLARAPAFQHAVRMAGGPGHGWLAYRLERETVRHFVDRLRQSPEALQEALAWAAVSETATRAVAGLAGWIDLSRLPAFDTLARHFQFSVETLRAEPDTLSLVTFRPPAPTSPPTPVPPPLPAQVPAAGIPPRPTPTPTPAASSPPPTAKPTPPAAPSSGEIRLE